jgi:glycosidase
MSAMSHNSLRNLVIYSIYVRSHGPNGTFADVENDLPRIREMGADTIWFMPLHPIGKVNVKGIGSPYSISDYRAINPEYGTVDDFKRVIQKAHDLGLKVMIDVVYNHTAHDAIYIHEHPEWYHLDSNNRPITTVPEWSDVIDLNYGSPENPNEELWAYLIDSLKYWVSLGVDGFRCDVAPLIPIDFWIRARHEVAKLNPNTIWLAETVHPGFIVERRKQGRTAHSDGEIYRAFDIAYDHDILEVWRSCVMQEASTERYLEFVLQQDSLYPENYCKLRFVENHDQPRAIQFIPTRDQTIAWTAFQAFNKGAFLIYAGQEAADKHKPSLSDREPIQWGSYELQPLLTKLAKLKKDPALSGSFSIVDCGPPIQAVWEATNGDGLYGIFNVHTTDTTLNVPLRDGIYADLLSDSEIQISRKRLQTPKAACILRYQGKLQFEPFDPPLWYFNRVSFDHMASNYTAHVQP